MSNQPGPIEGLHLNLPPQPPPNRRPPIRLIGILAVVIVAFVAMMHGKGTKSAGTDAAVPAAQSAIATSAAVPSPTTSPRTLTSTTTKATRATPVASTTARATHRATAIKAVVQQTPPTATSTPRSTTQAAISTTTSKATTAAPSVVSFGNCTEMHTRFPHGVARVGGVDLVRGKARVPQEAYYVSNAWYYANSALDRDGDGVACESV